MRWQMSRNLKEVNNPWSYLDNGFPRIGNEGADTDGMFDVLGQEASVTGAE